MGRRRVCNVALVTVFLVWFSIFRWLCRSYNTYDTPGYRPHRKPWQHDADVISYYGPRQSEQSHSKRGRLILLWTKFFTEEWKINFSECNCSCTATNDRTLVHTANAVFFHFADLDINDMPKIRNSDQVWILLIHESTSNIYQDFHAYKHVFNWTASFRRDATVYVPYGVARKRSVAVIGAKSEFSEKTKFAFAAVSNGNDKAKRYRIIHDLTSINGNVDMYGKSYGLACEVDSHHCLTDSTAGQYIFKLAFENSNCKHYVTEKFWLALEQGVIPVVNWVNGQADEDIIPPDSYINMYDFRDLLMLNEYLIEVSTSKSLYDSYFEWKKYYDLDKNYGTCNLCRSLYSTHNMKMSVDIEGWIENDFCYRFTVSLTLEFESIPLI